MGQTHSESMNSCIAHSVNEAGKPHGLVEHLRAVAEIAREFAKPFGGDEAAYYSGLWHDIGKFDTEFQRYLHGGRPHGPDHKGAGTKLACQHLGPAGLVIQGHHGGLKAAAALRGWVAEKGEARAAIQALETARQTIPDLEPRKKLKPPNFAAKDPVNAELWLRMVFSAVVDADYLDTERHFNPGKADVRKTDPTLEVLWERFQERHRENTREATGLVNEIRSEIYQACLDAAPNPTGVFRLTVPTGGGKTLSAMGFALRHATAHGMKQVIVATPFTSITQQTASVYREYLERNEEDSSLVLEHHSMAEPEEQDDYEGGSIWQKLAAENWDAPVVVTTTVQLFQSLFSNRTSATRKLHRLAESVIILDEAQTLPPNLLAPILDTLKELTENYGTTVVLSTATQPALQAIKAFADVAPKEIVPNFEKHFQTLKRVNYDWKTESPTSWEEVAETLRGSHQALAVVNTRKDALNLLEALGDDDAFHLSTLLCGIHRQRVIREIRDRLAKGSICRVVSTQVVEAGVDLDFPLVMRAVGPLDSIIQAAGRCNRSGLLESGRVVIFSPLDSRPPPGHYTTATQQTMSLLSAGPLDLDDQDTITTYFQRVFSISDDDARQIQNVRRELNYPEVANRFRMVEDDTVDVIVPNYGEPEERRMVEATLDKLRNGTPEARFLLRRVRPWTLQVYRSQVASNERSGLMAQVMPGVYEWLGGYDPVTGIGGITELDPDRLIA